MPSILDLQLHRLDPLSKVIQSLAHLSIPGLLLNGRKASLQGSQRCVHPRNFTLKRIKYLLVLRNRPSQRLTVPQIRTAIRKDTHKRCSRQAVNVNVNVLEEDGLVKRARAPKGSGAQFVYWAA